MYIDIEILNLNLNLNIYYKINYLNLTIFIDKRPSRQKVNKNKLENSLLRYIILNCSISHKLTVFYSMEHQLRHSSMKYTFRWHHINKIWTRNITKHNKRIIWSNFLSSRNNDDNEAEQNAFKPTHLQKVASP